MHSCLNNKLGSPSHPVEFTTSRIAYAAHVRYIGYHSRPFPSVLTHIEPTMIQHEVMRRVFQAPLGNYRQRNSIAMPVNQVETQTPTLSMIKQNRTTPPESTLGLMPHACRCAFSFRIPSSSTSFHSSLRPLDSACPSLVAGCHSFLRTSTESRYCLCRRGASPRPAFASRVLRHQGMLLSGCRGLRVSLRESQM